MKNGFTLIEIMVTTMVVVTVGASIAGLSYIMNRTQLTVLNGSLNTDQANASLASLSKELRTARAGDQGAYIFESVTPQSIVFYSDIDADGNSERVRYFLQGTSFKKGTIKPVGNPATYPTNTEKIREITANVRNGTTGVFAYFDENKQPTSNISLVRLVGIYLRVNQKANDPTRDYVLETSANVRTLKENL